MSDKEKETITKDDVGELDIPDEEVPAVEDDDEEDVGEEIEDDEDDDDDEPEIVT